jgi:hypothetical protein
MVQQVNLAAVGASLKGSVTAKANQAPLPRIVVQLFRLDRHGVLVPKSSAATGDDGTFSFDKLLPGNYKLLISGAGFVKQWYPDAATKEAAQIVTLPTVATKDGEKPIPTELVISMKGDDGGLSGQVIAPEKKPGDAIQVSLVQTGTASPEWTNPPPVVCTGGVTCNFAFSPLPTPAGYELTLSAPGFADRVIKQSLEAGQILVVNTVTLGAAPSSIQGTVTTGDGTPIGGVKVTVSSGQFTKTVTTPTAGAQIGVYKVDGLETPRTYVITMALDGYQGQTQAIDLVPGVPGTVNGRMLGGIGTINGLVTDLGTPPVGLGGVKVVATSGTFRAETATLTGGQNAPSGTYSLTGLPTPGRYTVTMSFAGYESETLVVDIGDTLPLEQNAQLKRSTAIVTGIVRVGGVAANDITMELSDGGKPRTTVTATNQANNQPGSYVLADIPPGSYTLTAKRSGIVARVLLVSVVAGDELTRNIDLPAP